MPQGRHIANRLAGTLRRLMGGEAGSGVLLVLAAAAAMLAANTPLAAAYLGLLDGPLTWTPVAKLSTPSLWIDDGLMAIFFFVVGLEIKRELIGGELADADRRRLPVAAAVAGMAVPAAIYLAIAGTAPPLGRGWAIPAATDIAFALGVIGLLGNRVPPALRLFLLTVAIVDDLGAIVIIALFYTATVKLGWLAAAMSLLAGMMILNRLRVTLGSAYVLMATALWYCVLHSGIHATIAGVLAALTVPMRLDSRGDSLLLRMEHALVPWNAYLIVPLFGFANAGVALTSANGHAPSPLPLAVGAGLVVGKQIGVLGAIFLAERTGFAPRPAGTSWLQVWGVALLCGIGFTMSLFIAGLAFPEDATLVDQAKIGILGGSLLSALLGFAVLRTASPRTA